MTYDEQEGGQISVAIAGGGIAGLALAAGLVKLPHVRVTVYEAVAEYRNVGAGLALHLNAIKAMTLIAPELRRAYLDKALSMGDDEDQEMVTEVILAHGPHQGQRVAELGRAKGRKSVSRADLLAGFLDLLPRDVVRFGKKLDGIEDVGEKVRLTFADGSTAHADCLVGADGIHSVARRYVLGADHPATAPVNHEGWVIYRTLVPTSVALREFGIDPRWTTHVPILLGPRGHINVIPLNKNTRLSAGVAVRFGSARNNDDSNNSNSKGDSPVLDPELYKDYSEDAQRIVRLVARDTSASWTAADHDHAPTYVRGRVCIIGDAAHASLPFAGNGAAQALEDAAVLSRLFEAITITRRTGETTPTTTTTSTRDPSWMPAIVEKAFGAFDTTRRPRSQAVVDLARRFGRVYAYAKEEEGMHEDPGRMRAFFADAAGFTNAFDVAAQNERAVNLFLGSDK